MYLQLHIEPQERGSKPWFGNFKLGLEFVNHPRFWEIVVDLLFFSVILSGKRK